MHLENPRVNLQLYQISTHGKVEIIKTFFCRKRLRKQLPQQTHEKKSQLYIPSETYVKQINRSVPRLG